MMNVNKVNNKTYFKKIIIDSIRLTIAIEFILNFFTFSFFKEFILVPIIVFSATMQSVASFNPKHKQVEKIFKYLLTYLLIVVFSFLAIQDG